MVAMTATFSLYSLPGTSPSSQANAGGKGKPSNTVSRTIFSGHGAASPIAVSTTMATTTMNSHFRYGRTSCTANLSTFQHGTRCGCAIGYSAGTDAFDTIRTCQ